MSTLAFSAGMAAPLVYLSFSFYDRYGFSKKLCNAFCAASCIAAALTALLSDRKSTRLNSSHSGQSRMPSSA